MITFHYELDFFLPNETKTSSWVSSVISDEEHNLDEINYIFCTDDYLSHLNKKFLSHDTLTDIISFDYSVGKTISGDIFISIDRVKENAKTFNVTFAEELNRVIIHGVLHFCGYKDKSENEKTTMRDKENYYLNRQQTP